MRIYDLSIFDILTPSQPPTKSHHHHQQRATTGKGHQNQLQQGCGTESWAPRQDYAPYRLCGRCVMHEGRARWPVEGLHTRHPVAHRRTP